MMQNSPGTIEANSWLMTSHCDLGNPVGRGARSYVLVASSWWCFKARQVSDLFTFSYRHQKGEDTMATMPTYHSLYVSAAPTNQAMTKTSTKHQSYEPLNKHQSNYGYSSSPKTQEHKEKHVRFYPEVRVRLFPREERWKTKYSTILWSLLIYLSTYTYLSDILCYCTLVTTL